MKVTKLPRLFETPWCAANQAPLSMEFSRQEYRSGLPFLSPGDLPDPGIKHRSLALQVSVLPSEPPGKSQFSTHPKFLPSSPPTTPSQPRPPKSVREYENHYSSWERLQWPPTELCFCPHFSTIYSQYSNKNNPVKM